MTHSILQVEGMSCQHCVRSIEGALSKVAGVQTAKVDLGQGNVAVDFDQNQVSLDRIKEAIEEQGYDVRAEV